MYVNPTSGAAPVAGATRVAAAPALSTAHLELIQSADVLSNVAASRPGGFIRGAELVEMANDTQGLYHPNIRHAAQVFLVNNRGVSRAREAIRRQCANPRSACAAGRAYDFQDLQSMSRYMQEHPHDEQGGGGGQPRSGNPYSMPGMQAFNAGHGYQDLFGQMMAAIRQLSDELVALQRRHMSLERLMSMDRQGHAGAGFMLSQPDMLTAIFDQAVHRNKAISLERLRQVGGQVDAHGNITSMGTGGADLFEGPADISAGRWWESHPAASNVPGAFGHAGFSGANLSPPFGGSFGSSATVSPMQAQPDFPSAAAADDVRRNEVLRQQQAANQVVHNEQLRVEREARARAAAMEVHDDTLRAANLHAAQQRIDDVKQQQRMADDVAAEQRRAEDIRSDQIRADLK